MKINDKIRSLRELNNWSQEDMAERMQMSKNGYARIERGESKLSIERLEQIAGVFNIDLVELMTQEYERVIFLIGGNSTNTGNNTNYYSNDDAIIAENERLKLIIQCKDELLTQKNSEIETLKTMIAVLQQNAKS